MMGGKYQQAAETVNQKYELSNSTSTGCTSFSKASCPQNNTTKQASNVQIHQSMGIHPSFIPPHCSFPKFRQYIYQGVAKIEYLLSELGQIWYRLYTVISFPFAAQTISFGWLIQDKSQFSNTPVQCLTALSLFLFLMPFSFQLHA